MSNSRNTATATLIALGAAIAAIFAGQQVLIRQARIARERIGKPLGEHAIVGSETHELPQQIEAIPKGYRPDAAVIVVGGNDVTHLIPPEHATKHLAAAIAELHHMGARVVVGTCPDLGSLRPVPQPLRSILSMMSWRMARHQTRVARREGAIAVDLRRAVGPMFRSEPDELFSVDQFHPSAAGYRRTAAALTPFIFEALRDIT